MDPEQFKGKLGERFGHIKSSDLLGRSDNTLNVPNSCLYFEGHGLMRFPLLANELRMTSTLDQVISENQHIIA